MDRMIVISLMFYALPVVHCLAAIAKPVSIPPEPMPAPMPKTIQSNSMMGSRMMPGSPMSPNMSGLSQVIGESPMSGMQMPFGSMMSTPGMPMGMGGFPMGGPPMSMGGMPMGGAPMSMGGIPMGGAPMSMGGMPMGMGGFPFGGMPMGMGSMPMGGNPMGMGGFPMGGMMPMMSGMMPMMGGMMPWMGGFGHPSAAPPGGEVEYDPPEAPAAPAAPAAPTQPQPPAPTGPTTAADAAGAGGAAGAGAEGSLQMKRMVEMVAKIITGMITPDGKGGMNGGTLMESMQNPMSNTAGVPMRGMEMPMFGQPGMPMLGHSSMQMGGTNMPMSPTSSLSMGDMGIGGMDTSMSGTGGPAMRSMMLGGKEVLPMGSIAMAMNRKWDIFNRNMQSGSRNGIPRFPSQANEIPMSNIKSSFVDNLMVGKPRINLDSLPIPMEIWDKSKMQSKMIPMSRNASEAFQINGLSMLNSVKGGNPMSLGGSGMKIGEPMSMPISRQGIPIPFGSGMSPMMKIDRQNLMKQLLLK